MLRYLTAGESHGKSLSTILEGIPAGLKLSESDINKELARRQTGYGRSQRMRIEEDKVEITSGLRKGKTIGSPLTLIIENKSRDLLEKKVTLPRPGHADLAGAIKYGTQDIRDILERASARETAARVALGAVAKKLLEEFKIEIISHIVRIGRIESKINLAQAKACDYEVAATSNHQVAATFRLRKKIETSAVRCLDRKASQEMIKEIEKAKKKGDSLGGSFEVIVTGLPPGLGSYIHWERRLDARLTQSLMSIPGIKGVEVGLGFSAASKFGSQVQDEIFYNKKGFYRKTNRAGGIEGGMSNGEWVILRAAMKPIPTLRKPLRSVDLITKKPSWASVERADVCAVPAAGVIGEAVVALEIARTMQEKFGGDNLAEIKRNYKNYLNYVKNI
jgi:chorismate synthase